MSQHRSPPASARRLGGSLALPSALVAALWAMAPAHAASAGDPWEGPTSTLGSRREAAAMLMAYFEEMCRPKPFVVRSGDALKAHQKELRERLLACAGLWPLPERVPLDVHASEPLDHEWCTVRRIYYQLWPKVYSSGLLFMPKRVPERPAPAVLCPHGHWANGNAHPEVQRRCLVLAKMGYVVFSSTQSHYEDPALGVSHQTLMLWNNIRALDYLESLPEVDGKRIGCAGASGGGLQTQMLVAADDRVRAATIVGMTCDYREIVFPGRHHCGCNHFPNIMRYTDEPELSALSLTPVQYLTMNDWTRSFEKSSYPTIRRLYELNGLKGHTDCKYWPTGHSYDKPKRERTYWWMDKWLRGKDSGGPVAEPEVKTLPVETLKKLTASVPGDKGFRHISRVFAGKAQHVAPKIANREEWEAYRKRMRAALRELLGEPVPARGKLRVVGREERDGLAIERVLIPSEGDILVPTLVVHPTAAQGKLPAVVVLHEGGKETMPVDQAPDSLLVLPDVRFVGELSLRAMAGLTKELATFQACSPLGDGKPETFDRVWERNAMLWGRPVPGMAATDIGAVVAYVASRPEVDPKRITVYAGGKLGVAALFAAGLDDRISSAGIHLKGLCFEKRNLPLVPFVLRHGDVLQWAALLANRELSLGGVPKEAGDVAWLKGVFEAAGNPRGLRR